MMDIATTALRKVVHNGVRIAFAAAPTEWSGIPEPASHAFVHASGMSPLKLLLFGGGPSIGYGVTDHDISLAGHFARALARELSRGVDLEVRIQKELSAVDSVRLDRVMRSTRYDAIIVTMGVQDAAYLDSDAEWSSTVISLIAALRGDTDTPLYFIGLPPFSAMISAGRVAGRILDRRVARMNDELKRLSESLEGVHFAEFDREVHTDDLKVRASTTYRNWAAAMVRVLGADLGCLPSSPCGRKNEDARQRALDDLHILDTPPEERFDRITTVAQRYFHTKGAAISLIDRDRQWFKSRRGIDDTQTTRKMAMCDYTIRSEQEFVVTDSRTDPRLVDNPELASSPDLRSYAGWPIDSPTGEHVGALCVFDPEPRTFSDSDLAFLRDLAVLVQQELARTAA